MKHLIVLLWLWLAHLSQTAKLPSTFTKCDFKQNDFQQCLTKATENAIRQMSRPDKQVGLLSLEPLEIPKMNIGAGSQLVATEQNFENVKLSGFNETVCSKVEFDFERKTLKIDCVVPRFRMDFEYEVRGQVLLIGLNANGTGWAVFRKLLITSASVCFGIGKVVQSAKKFDCTNKRDSLATNDDRFEITFNLKEREKKGKKYYGVVSQQLTMQPKDIDFDLKHLFGGDEEAAARAKKIFRNSILDIYDDIRSGYEEAFGKIFASVFDRILAKVPAADLFGKM